MNYRVAAYSDIGIKKQTNQDSLLAKVANSGYGKIAFCVMCDGLGGLQKGELASATMIKKLNEWFLQTFPSLLENNSQQQQIQDSIIGVIQYVDCEMKKYSSKNHSSMGTTAAILLIYSNQYYIWNIGDSRIYLLRQSMRQITKDHTVVQKEIDLGLLTYDQIETHPNKNVLLQCIGASENIVVDFFVGEAETGDTFLLCSDGFRHAVKEQEIFQKLNASACQTEVEMTKGIMELVELNKVRNETDNISAVLLQVF